MKKFLLAMGIAAFGVLGASATDYTVFDINNPGTWTGDANGWSREKDANGFTLTTAKAASTNALLSPADNQYSWRVYKKSEFTITSESVDMKTIVITYDDYNNGQYAKELVLSDGWSGTLSGAAYTLSSAGLKTLTATAETAQVRIKKIVVSDQEPGSTPSNPGGETGNAYTIFDIANPGTWTGDANGWSREKDANGFTLTTVKAASTNDLLSPADNKYSWRVYKKSEFTITSESVDMKTIVITYDDYNSGQYAKELVLSDGWSGTLSGAAYTLSSAGLKTLTATAETAQVRITKIVAYDYVYTPGGENPPVEEVKSVNSIQEILALDADTKVKIEFPMTVAFRNYRNVYACDESGDFIQLYGDNQYEVSDVIPAGYEVTYKLYSGVTPELEGTLPAATAAGDFEPKVVPASNVTTSLVNHVIIVKDVTFTEATPADKSNFTGTSEGVTLNFRNNYTLASVEPGTYNVRMVVTIYQNAPSLYVIEYNKASGIDNVASSDNSEAVYYNLQGVRVTNPENGIYIVVKGDKTAKVMF